MRRKSEEEENTSLEELKPWIGGFAGGLLASGLGYAGTRYLKYRASAVNVQDMSLKDAILTEHLSEWLFAYYGTGITVFLVLVFFAIGFWFLYSSIETN